MPTTRQIQSITIQFQPNTTEVRRISVESIATMTDPDQPDRTFALQEVARPDVTAMASSQNTVLRSFLGLAETLLEANKPLRSS